MPFAFIIVGAVLVIAGVRGTSKDLLSLLNNDLRGQNNYIYWFLSIMLIGALGYVGPLKPFSRALLVLVIIVLVLANDKSGNPGFFQQFNSAINEISNRDASTPTTNVATSVAPSTSSLSGLASLPGLSSLSDVLDTRQ